MLAKLQLAMQLFTDLQLIKSHLQSFCYTIPYPNGNRSFRTQVISYPSHFVPFWSFLTHFYFQFGHFVPRLVISYPFRTQFGHFVPTFTIFTRSSNLLSSFSVCLSVYEYLSICLSIYLSVCLSVCLPTYQPTYLPFLPFLPYLPTHTPIVKELFEYQTQAAP